MKPVLLPWVAVAVLSSILLGAPPARAQDAKARARALLQEGARRYEAADYKGALEKFEAARRLVPSPKIFYNLGLALRGLARDAEAVEAFEHFLAEAKDAPAASRAEAREAVATLFPRLGEIRIECNSDGAGIWLDGRELGTTPRAAPIRASAGAHQVVVSRSGWPAHVEQVRVVAGGTVSVRAVLAAPAGRPAPPPPSAPPSEAPVVVASAGRPVERLDLSHAGQFGLSLGLHLALHPEMGQRILPGLSYGVTSMVELTGGAILGKQAKGGWLGGRVFLLQGTWKPELSFTVPIFFPGSQIAVGLQASAGVTLDLTPHAGLYAALGAAVFPRATVSADRFWLLASTGAQARF